MKGHENVKDTVHISEPRLHVRACARQARRRHRRGSTLFEYEGEAPERLWRVEGGPEVDLITDSLVDALAEQFAGDADLLHSIDVVGSDNALRDLHPMVMARGPE
jgi:hypothetical protein